jgi:hypothetical protein
VESDALATLILNKLRAGIKVCFPIRRFTYLFLGSLNIWFVVLLIWFVFIPLIILGMCNQSPWFWWKPEIWSPRSCCSYRRSSKLSIRNKTIAIFQFLLINKLVIHFVYTFSLSPKSLAWILKKLILMCLALAKRYQFSLIVIKFQYTVEFW